MDPRKIDRRWAADKAKKLVAQMSVAEAAGQLRFDAPAISRLGVPAYNWWNETLHGVARNGTATSFPQAIGMAAAFSPALLRRAGEICATEARAKYNACVRRGDRDIFKGLTFWSPNINIFRDPRWGRGQETYGEDPFLTAELGKAFVHGLQGDGPHLKAAACAKHFAAHSGPEALRHSFNAVVSPKDMAETYLPAFEALVRQAHVEAVMGAYNRTNGEPCCGSETLLADTLRGKWGFEGHVVSDCWAVRDFHEEHHVTACPEESVALALGAGCDVNCGCTYQYVLSAYEKGLISEETIRTAAVRLFTTRYLLGTLDGSEFDDIPFTVVECGAHRAAAREAAERACVLLKNDGLLPLRRAALKTIAVIGPNADSRAALVGNYHGVSSHYVTLLQGIQNAAPEARVLYAQGCHLCKPSIEALSQPDDGLAEAVTAAECADVVILALGFDESVEGEEGCTADSILGGDKADLLLPLPQRKLLEAVLGVGKPTVLCLMSGSALDPGDGADAILQLWYPGAEGGTAAARLLFGDVSPSGKLPVTFYRNEDLARLPDFTDYSMDGRTYRYLRTAPLYPFGFGLSYGRTAVIGAEARWSPEGVELTVKFCNENGMDTEEVLQVYCQNEGSANAPAHPRLCGFLRVNCPVGKTQIARLHIPAACFLVVNDNGRRIAEGRPVLYAGFGQPDARTVALTGQKALRLPCPAGYEFQ